MAYRSEIDGLRAVAILPVIFFHAGFELLSGGYVGVDIFFVISGYLITKIFISEIKENNFSMLAFYERRARRILPAIFFVMAICLSLAAVLFTPSHLKDFGRSQIAVSTFSSNILFWKSSGYFETTAELNPLLHTWSLAVEEQFYFIFPILFVVTWRFGHIFQLSFLLFIFGVSLGVSQWGAYNHSAAAFYLLPSRIWELVIGVYTALHLERYGHPKSLVLNQLLSMTGLVLITFAILSFDEMTQFPGLYALIPTVGAGLLILCTVPSTFIHKLLSLRILVFIGLISYSTYLWHQPVFVFAQYYAMSELSPALLAILCAVSLLLGGVTWHFIETPFRSMSVKKRRNTLRYSVIVSVLFILSGGYLNYSNGGLDFYPEDRKRVLASFINPSVYVSKRHLTINNRDFSTEHSRKKILIIGDSHSQDLVNAVFEAGLNNSIEFSAFYIPVACGVLFVKDKPSRARGTVNCRDQDFSIFTGSVEDRVSDASEVWIISSWSNSDLAYMERSLRNISVLNKNSIIFGTKGFGKVDDNWYKRTSKETWSREFISLSDVSRFSDIFEINLRIDDIARSVGLKFINTQSLLCDGEAYCSNYRDGNVISYDGEHLTQHGATILGAALKDHLKSEKVLAKSN